MFGARRGRPSPWVVSYPCRPSSHGPHRPRPRLPARPPRRRADLRRDGRRLARGPDLHAALRRGGDRRALRRPRRDHVAAAAPAHPPARLSRPAAAARAGHARLALGDVDCVLSSSTAFAHGVRKPPGARHVCYCNSPFRYAWHERAVALAEVPAPLRPALSAPAAPPPRLRPARGGRRRPVHRQRADRPRADPALLGPRRARGAPARRGRALRDRRAGRPRPVRRGARAPQAPGGRHRGRARRRARDQGRRLRSRAPPPARALRRPGAVPGPRRRRGARASSTAGAAALVVPNVEEFGIAAVEAQAAGRPVVGIGAGGAAGDRRARAAPACSSHPATPGPWPARCART